MLIGLRTVLYPVTDLDAAKAFYSSLLGKQPYFDMPFYVGYEVGGFELGLDPNSPVTPAGQDGGSIACWGVQNVPEAYARCLELGGTGVEAPHEVGGGIYYALVKDPFGNRIGLIFNPSFDIAKVC